MSKILFNKSSFLNSQIGSLLNFQFPPASFAFSLRRLYPSYMGACIRVRRSLDNMEMDIGFYEDSINLAQLMPFVGAGDGAVVFFYSQRNGAILIQPTTSQQPLIVKNGVLITKNGKPSLYLDNTQGQHLYMNNIDFTSLIANQKGSIFFVAAGENTGGTQVGFGMRDGSNTYRWILDYFAGPGGFFAGSSAEKLAYNNPITSTLIQSSLVRNGANASASINKSVMASANNFFTSPSGSSTFTFGGYRNPSIQYAFKGYFSEIILFNDDIGSNKILLENNQISYYNIS